METVPVFNSRDVIVKVIVLAIVIFLGSLAAYAHNDPMVQKAAADLHIGQLTSIRP